MLKPPENIPVEMETMTSAQIYTALDARARDLRSFMLAYFAGMLTSGAGLVNALPEGHASTAQLIRMGYYLVISLALFAGGMLCARQGRRNVRRAEYIRKKFSNCHDVPVVDRLFELSEIFRPREFRVPDENQ